MRLKLNTTRSHSIRDARPRDANTHSSDGWNDFTALIGFDLSTLRAFNSHNYCHVSSAADKKEFMTECDYSLEALHLFDSVTLIAGFFWRVRFTSGVRKSAAARLRKQREAERSRRASVSHTFIPLTASFSLSPFSWVINETCNSFIIANVTFLKTWF